VCGIAAIFARSPQAAIAMSELERISEHLRRRGPDGEGTWVDPGGRVAMAHRRLAIIDTSESGAQPMHHGPFTVVYNGEIFNYRELKAGLLAKGRTFRSGSDTEVLLQLYEEHGRNMLPMLRGMFAFALWDGRNRDLLLARDPHGIKPLYLSTSGGVTRVASQVKALLAGGAISRAPSPAGRAGFHLFGHVPEPYTFYRDIRSLPAGSALLLGEGGEEESWSFAGVLEEMAAAECSPSGDASSVRADILGSVRAHLVADVPVGIFLSSGIDSAALTGLVAETGATPRTVTLRFREYESTPRDEAPLAAEIARHYGAEHHTLEIDRAGFESAREDLLDAMDQPSIDGVNVYFVSRAARSLGLKVALTGLGGDELFGGYSNFQALPTWVRSFAWAGKVPTLGRAARSLLAGRVDRFVSPKAAGLLELGGTYGGAYLLRRGLFMPWELPAQLGNDLARNGLAELSLPRSLDALIAPLKSPFLRVSALETLLYMRNQLLRDADWASMAHGLEVRAPLVDLPLSRSVARAAAGGPISKRWLAASPARSLPQAVVQRPKTGFSIPVREWMAGSSGTGHSLREWARFVYRRFTEPER
jgi:asparagine synthase (glutamine-hydrolysing)